MWLAGKNLALCSGMEGSFQCASSGFRCEGRLRSTMAGHVGVGVGVGVREFERECSECKKRGCSAWASNILNDRARGKKYVLVTYSRNTNSENYVL